MSIAVSRLAHRPQPHERHRAELAIRTAPCPTRRRRPDRRCTARTHPTSAATSPIASAPRGTPSTQCTRSLPKSTRASCRSGRAGAQQLTSSKRHTVPTTERGPDGARDHARLGVSAVRRARRVLAGVGEVELSRDRGTADGESRRADGQRDQVRRRVLGRRELRVERLHEDRHRRHVAAEGDIEVVRRRRERNRLHEDAGLSRRQHDVAGVDGARVSRVPDQRSEPDRCDVGAPWHADHANAGTHAEQVAGVGVERRQEAPQHAHRRARWVLRLDHLAGGPHADAWLPR